MFLRGSSPVIVRTGKDGQISGEYVKKFYPSALLVRKFPKKTISSDIFKNLMCLANFKIYICFQFD